MSPGRFYIDKTKKKNTYTKISTVIKIYGDIDKAENSQKGTIFFSMSPRRFYIDMTKREHILENQYNNKNSTIIKIYGDIEKAKNSQKKTLHYINICGYRKNKKQPENDNTFYI